MCFIISTSGLLRAKLYLTSCSTHATIQSSDSFSFILSCVMLTDAKVAEFLQHLSLFVYLRKHVLLLNFITSLKHALCFVLTQLNEMNPLRTLALSLYIGNPKVCSNVGKKCRQPWSIYDTVCENMLTSTEYIAKWPTKFRPYSWD